MGKRKNTKDMLAARNPLQRVFVEPVDIYQQAEPEQVAVQEALVKEPVAKRAEAKPASKKAKAASNDDPLRPYSTYLRRSQVKNIKRHAVEREIKDMIIMQEAIDEYLRRHNL